jgi:hypothetical protein
LGVLVVELMHIHTELMGGVRPRDLLVYLNDLFLGLDHIVKQYSAYR